MAKTVEPQILMSRVLAFVFATSIVVLLALFFTLLQMAPLEKPEVFFLRNPTRTANTLTIIPITIENNEQLERYKDGFIREYVKARHTLYATMNLSEWQKIMRTWSSQDIYKQFTRTNVYKDAILSELTIPFSCEVAFPSVNDKLPIIPFANDPNSYIVNFIWLCKNSAGQTSRQNYKIKIKLKSEVDNSDPRNMLTNLEILRDNPLGIQVSEFSFEGKEDPLNSGPAM